MEQQIDVSLSLALKSISKLFLKYYKRALAGVAQWLSARLLTEGSLVQFPG